MNRQQLLNYLVRKLERVSIAEIEDIILDVNKEPFGVAAFEGRYTMYVLDGTERNPSFYQRVSNHGWCEYEMRLKETFDERHKMTLILEEAFEAYNIAREEGEKEDVEQQKCG